MAKRKKEPLKENKNTKMSDGRICKAKNKEMAGETPFTRKLQVKLTNTSLRQINKHMKLPERNISATPFSVKYMPKNTSTPIYTATAGNPMEITTLSPSLMLTKRNMQSKDYFALPSAQSPILGDISNLMASRGNVNRNQNSPEFFDKDNGHASFTKINQLLTLNKNLEECAQRTRRRHKNGLNSSLSPERAENEALGGLLKNPQNQRTTTRQNVCEIPKVADASRQYKEDKCSSLRVREARNLANAENSSLADASAPVKSLNAVTLTRSRCKSSHRFPEPNDIQSKSPNVVNALRADWTSTTLQDSSTLVNPLRATRRKLSPLLELSSYENSLSTLKHQSNVLTTAIGKDYSSSEEFESTNEMNNNRSKRAPTWKNLSTTISAQQTSYCAPVKVRVRRLRNQPKTLTAAVGTDAINKGLVSANTPKLDHISRLKTKAQDPINEGLVPANSSKLDSIPRITTLAREPTEGFDETIQRSIEGGSTKSALTTRVKVKVKRLPNHSKKSTPKPKTSDAICSVSLNEKAVSADSSKMDFILIHRATPSQENSEKGTRRIASSEDPTVCGQIVPSSSKPPYSKSPNIFEETISSHQDIDEHQPNCALSSTTNANFSKKFFTSRRDNTIGVIKTAATEEKGKRSSNRKRKRGSIYEFLSQSSSDSNDPVADIIQKMINTGKVVVAKHKKGKGKLVVPRRKRQLIKKNQKPQANGECVKPNPPPAAKRQALQEMDVEDLVTFDEDGEHIRDQRGFSQLARSAMVKRADRSHNISQRQMITDKQKLLQMAQKLVGQSTPVRAPLPRSGTDRFSPIPGCASPWRVDSKNLPNLFYFSRNSNNLPSFSSDHISSTPAKNKSSSLSSFSSNDSNGENVAPPSAQSNANHSPISLNSRRALTYRSPLKAINILEVVNLPPLAMNRSEKEIQSDSTKDKSYETVVGASSNCATNLFGFEEMIEEDDDHVDEIAHQPAIVGKQQLKEQMQKLKRLRTELPLATTSKKENIKSIFDDEHHKQKTLKQMFSSTMIETKSHPANNGIREKRFFNEIGNGDLFKDPEPETTFDQSIARRSYSRPFRKKRKLRHNFVMFMDSDASEGDDHESDKNYKKKPKERQRKPPQDDAELNKFVTEFNEMCREVSEYELVVE